MNIVLFEKLGEELLVGLGQFLAHDIGLDEGVFFLVFFDDKGDFLL